MFRLNNTAVNHKIPRYKKFFVINIIIIIFSVSFFSGGCSNRMVKQELLRIDRNFSELSGEKSSVEAFYQYMAEDGIVLPRESGPIGRDEYRRLLKRDSPDNHRHTLTWEPLFAEVAECGDLGYTHGKYQLITNNSSAVKDTTTGYYITIWKKQPDGTWKFIFDTGNKLP